VAGKSNHKSSFRAKGKEKKEAEDAYFLVARREERGGKKGKKKSAPFPKRDVSEGGKKKTVAF